MTNLHSILAKAGHGFADLGKWVDDAIKIFEKDIEPTANAVVAIAYPALTPIVAKIESIVHNIQTVSQAPLSSASLQAVTQAVTTLEMLAPGTITPAVVTKVTNVATEASAIGNAVKTAVTSNPIITSSAPPAKP